MQYRYYHYICSDTEKEIYAALLSGFLEYNNRIAIPFGNIPVDEVWKVITMVLYDNPRLFFVSKNKCRIITAIDKTIIEPQYTFPASSIIELNKWLNECIGEVCSPIFFVNDAFSKEIYIHNYLIQNVKYSKTNVAQSANAYTVIGALLENYSVCAGVALTFKLMMDFLDIPCIVAIGNTINQGSENSRHAWNIVQIDNEFYQLDVTWDLLEDQNDRIVKYDYFNLPDTEMVYSRIPDYAYPKCEHMNLNYFMYMNSIAYSISELQDIIERKVNSNEESIYVKYLNANLCNDEIHRMLNCIRGIGSYSFWHHQEMKTILIKRFKARCNNESIFIN